MSKILHQYFPWYETENLVQIDPIDWYFQDKILPFLDLFQREPIRSDLFKEILKAFVNRYIILSSNEFPFSIEYSRNPQEKTSDPVLVAAMVHCAKSVHDTLGFVHGIFVRVKNAFDCFVFRALTNDDELREVSGLLSALIRKVDYGKDVEQELKFCVEARGLFGYIDSVTITLIQVKLFINTNDNHAVCDL